MTDEIDDELPLAGIKVLDVSSFIAAPAACTTLGDWGADVIKIEPPGSGDPHRTSYQSANYPKAAANFPWQLDGRNKRSLALDLKNAEARTVLDRLIAQADVMVVNFPRPVRSRLRLHWEDVKPINPRLIYASLTGYGETGPEADTPGFDNNAFFARSGILDALRYEGQPPAFSLPAQGDRSTAMALVAAIMIGLYRRQRTGKGGWVGTSLYANGVWSTGTMAAGALLGATLPPRPPRERPRNALTNQYVAKDGRWFTLLIPREEKRWDTFCPAIDRADLMTDPRFAEIAERRANAAALVAELDHTFAQQDWPYWRDKLIAIGVAAAPINRLGDLGDDEQALHAGIIVPTASHDVPLSIATPLRLGFARMRDAGRAPEVGEHNAEVLGELGYDQAAIDALKAKGALG
jgi:crotonobetainyl-CoA:carnitine CoA-transferase CaiB-like acyl-CoA transferase